MAKLIDPNELEKAAHEHCGSCFSLNELAQHGDIFVDAVPVVHGQWLYDSGSGKYFCSACEENALSFKKDTLYGGELYEMCLTDYCPNCGACMDLEDQI